MKPGRYISLGVVVFAAAYGAAVFGQGLQPGADGSGDRKRNKGGDAVFFTETPATPGSVVPGRPTANSVTLSLLWHDNADGLLVWGSNPDALPAAGRRITLKKGEPQQVVIDGLSPNRRYFYALLEAGSGKRLLPVMGIGSFQTARPPGSSFTFSIQADSHLDGSCLPELYQRTLSNVLADSPDFHIDLGDTFMTEKHESRDSAARQYPAQHYYFGLIGQSVPLFLVLGNHDGEMLDRNGDAPADGLAVWSHKMRTRYFANPVPNEFYTGNTQRHPTAGVLQNYYSWEWGDGLFVVIDPYWTSLPTRGGRSPWNMTIGKAQYTWLAKTLRRSRAKFKFVFIHQLTGSYNPAGRGGAEASYYQEWGGHDIDGAESFQKNRPGWELPIHSLLKDNGVNLVFHGHDHFYARQEKDGVIYQLVPQPAHRNDRTHHAEEYGYKEGTFIASSGYLRVNVSDSQVKVDYVRSALPGQYNGRLVNKVLSDSYTIQASSSK